GHQGCSTDIGACTGYGVCRRFGVSAGNPVTAFPVSVLPLLGHHAPHEVSPAWRTKLLAARSDAFFDGHLLDALITHHGHLITVVQDGYGVSKDQVLHRVSVRAQAQHGDRRGWSAGMP